MSRFAYIFLLLTIFPSNRLFAQKADSTAIISAKVIDELSKKAVPADIDTSFLNTHFYNPVYRETFSPQYNGNTGSPFQNNIFSKRNNQDIFLFAKPFTTYYHTPYKRLHYNTHRPFTEISYVTAGNRETSEQLISALHTQNINKYTNVGVDYDLIASKGIYLQQEVKANRFTFFGSYDKDNYSIYGNVSSNRTKEQENGGLANFQEFIVHPATDPVAYQMSLSNASSMLKNLTVFATQSYRFKKSVSDSISLPADSLQTLNDSLYMQSDSLTALNDTTTKTQKSMPVVREKSLPFMINHTIRYDRFSRVYNDQAVSSDTIPGFYQNNYYNLNSAYDSVFQHVLENSFQISGDEYKFLPGFILGIKHQLVAYSYLYPRPTSITVNSVIIDTILPGDFKTNYNNLSLYAMLLFESKSKITYQGKIEYFFAGYRQNDIMADFKLNYKLNKKGDKISAFGKFYVTEPDFFLKQYYSSHFQWNNTFPKSSTTSAFASYTSGNGTVYAEGGLTLLGNYIYLDNMAIPAKADNTILVTSFMLEKTFKWGGFNHIHKLIIQKATNEAVLQIPLLAYGNTSYYENAFFKGALKFQIGFDFYVNSGYFADAWMPATGMFYRQDIARIGEYPFLDGFFNWKIKRTRFFLKYTNSLAGIAGYNYFTTYGYPMNPGSLKFGLTWTFYD